MTPLKYYSTEINKLKRLSSNKHGYMLPHYIGEKEKKEEGEKIEVGFFKSSKRFFEMNHDIYIKNRKICKGCFSQNRRI